MSEIIFLVEEAGDGGYTAKALGSPIFTEADTVDELTPTFEMPCNATLTNARHPKSFVYILYATK